MRADRVRLSHAVLRQDELPLRQHRFAAIHPQPPRPAAAPTYLCVVSSLQKRSWVEQVMGLPISLLARGPAARTAAADAAAQAVYRELREVDRTFSTYRPDSEVSRLVRGELKWEAAAPVVREVADRCLQARDLTGGLFDAETPAGRLGSVRVW